MGSLPPFRSEMGATSLLNQLASQEKSINYPCIIILILVYSYWETSKKDGSHLAGQVWGSDGSVGSLPPFRSEVGATSLLNQLASHEKSINYPCIIILILVYSYWETSKKDGSHLAGQVWGSDGSVGSLPPFRSEMEPTSLLNHLASHEKSIS